MIKLAMFRQCAIIHTWKANNERQEDENSGNFSSWPCNWLASVVANTGRGKHN